MFAASPPRAMVKVYTATFFAGCSQKSQRRGDGIVVARLRLDRTVQAEFVCGMSPSLSDAGRLRRLSHTRLIGVSHPWGMLPRDVRLRDVWIVHLKNSRDVTTVSRLRDVSLEPLSEAVPR